MNIRYSICFQRGIKTWNIIYIFSLMKTDNKGVTMNHSIEIIDELKEINVPLERDEFCRTIIRELSGLLEDMVGLEEASGFISIVGQNIGNTIDADYKKALQVKDLSKEQVANVLVDLKHRINGGFFIKEMTDTKVVFGNTLCPFEDKVKDRTSLCMMTSNVFGTVASNNLGYAKVELKETIARGDSGCNVVVYFEANDESDATEGIEYIS